MNKIKPWYPFIVLAIFFLVLSQINKTSIQLHLYDTYYIIKGSRWYVALAIISLIPALAYFFTNKYLYSSTITWIHIIGTFIGIICLRCNWYHPELRPIPNPHGYPVPDLPMEAQNEYLIAISVIALLLLQLLYPYNLLRGIIKHPKG
ncbi:hypothetical protein ACE38W_02935 [Chitinophaga sp. Hz27]|uniref:hypothetical protein n=1 Tax=Chitinophaga sp. Hz27 TaxID=3347169 RepID=UPI0035D9C70E